MSASISTMNSSGCHISHHAHRLACAAVSGWLLFTTPVFAAVGALDPFGGLNRVSETQLEGMRGGFRVNGFEMRFGMRVESSVSGIGKVVTLLTWGGPSHKWTPTSTTVYSADGAQQPASSAVPAVANAQQSAGAQPPTVETNAGATPPVATIPTAPVPAAIPVSVPEVPTVASSVEPTLSVPNAPNPTSVASSPAVVTSSAVPQSVASYLDQQPSSTIAQNDGGFELTLADNGGTQTQILHQITEGHVAALISNQANGVTISQSTTLDVGLVNFAQVMGNAMNVIRTRSVVGSGVNRY